jgi:hypothetical protein
LRVKPEKIKEEMGPVKRSYTEGHKVPIAIGITEGHREF